MVQSLTYKNPINGRYYNPNEILNIEEPIDPNTGDKLEVI